MAAFYGTVQGERGEAHRIGHRCMDVTAASWQGAIHVQLTKGDDGVVQAFVEMIEWSGYGNRRVLYQGPVDADGQPASVRTEEKIFSDVELGIVST